nr:restriction endonuclease [Candidatus Sigynarchaeota archaeon]
MEELEVTVWGIRAGRRGEANSLFLEKNCVALGWSKIEAMSSFTTHQVMKERIKIVYPDTKQGAIPVYAGMFHRFVFEIKEGDIIVYPSKVDGQIHLGRIAGPYIYDPIKDSNFPHIRDVKWIQAVPRTHFTQGALYEISAWMSFFLIKNYAEEFIAAIEESVVPTPVTAPEDETIGSVIESTEENTRDYIRKTLIKKLKGHPFEDFIAHLLEMMGYRTRISHLGPDGGTDIKAYRDELGFETPIKVQVKSIDANIGRGDVSAFSGSVAQEENGLFITLSDFSSQARDFANGKPKLRLIDGDELIDLILRYYDQLDPYYKGILPLKQIWIPSSQEDEEE